MKHHCIANAVMLPTATELNPSSATSAFVLPSGVLSFITYLTAAANNRLGQTSLALVH